MPAGPIGNSWESTSWDVNTSWDNLSWEGGAPAAGGSHRYPYRRTIGYRLIGSCILLAITLSQIA
jgi:hypothetical protein